MSRLVVVTGAGGGIGRAVVATFRQAGDDVVALGRNRDTLEAAGATSVEVCDVTHERAVGAAFDRIGPIDVLVNGAGMSTSAPLERTTLHDWRAQLEVNATGAFLCTRAVLPGMVDRGDGRIVMVASTAGRAGHPYTAGYAASKHALVGLMRATAAEVAGRGVTANAVCPAFVRTDMTRRSVERIVAATGREARSVEATLARSSPLGRLLEPEEIAFAVAFLAAPEAGAVNGQALVLDGGALQA